MIEGSEFFKTGDEVILPAELGSARARVTYISGFSKKADVMLELSTGTHVSVVNFPLSLLTKPLPPEPMEVGYIYESPRDGHKYVRIDRASRRYELWFRITSGQTPYSAFRNWEDIA